jgi:transcriptional regulator with XRE-family HTH domain
MSKETDEHIARANRVRSLRKMTNLSRNEFQKRFGVAPGTLQHWEDPQKNGLTVKGAKRLTLVLKNAGIYCSLDWILYGRGPGPQYLPSTDEAPISAPIKLHRVAETNEGDCIASELSLFTQHYPEVINAVVTDDAMEPRFIKGEYVAGIRRYKKFIDDLVGLDCIVVTTEGELLIRRIRTLEAPGFYTLSSLNLNTTIAHPVLYHAELVSAAPIIWTRRIHQH